MALIDAFKFSRLAEHLEGEMAIAQMARVVEVSPDRLGVMRWALQGGVDKLGYPQLRLQVSGAIDLLCQRCLAPLKFEVDSEAILILAKDDARADEIEALLDDEAVDVIAVTGDLNLYDLIEDEVLLALPFAPKHAVCPDQLASSDVAGSDKLSPFAVLKNLK